MKTPNRVTNIGVEEAIRQVKEITQKRCKQVINGNRIKSDRKGKRTDPSWSSQLAALRNDVKTPRRWYQRETENEVRSSDYKVQYKRARWKFTKEITKAKRASWDASWKTNLGKPFGTRYKFIWGVFNYRLKLAGIQLPDGLKTTDVDGTYKVLINYHLTRFGFLREKWQFYRRGWS